MQRMTRVPSHQTPINAGPWLKAAISRLCMAAVAFASVATVGLTTADAQMAGVAQADYQGSGFVTPAGMIPPDVYFNQMYPQGVMPVGYLSGGSACDAGCCGSPGCSSGGCSSGGCSSGGGIFGADECDDCESGGGILGKLGKCGCGSRCKNCLGLGCLSCKFGGSCLGCGIGKKCLFCRGAGCSACSLWNRGSCAAAMAPFLDFLKPHDAAGLCAMRWYDLSLEGVFLDHSIGGSGGVLTTQGVQGNPVLSLGDASVDMEAGVRVSVATICGAGGNLEFSYMGGQTWNGRAAVSDPNAQLYSVISNFGVLNGFDDTDQSLVQSIDLRSELHSGELNYRRRTVWPCCRFQGSWLVGLKYVRYDDRLLYSTEGEVNNTGGGNLPRFFSSNDKYKNNLFGGQAGFDFWWNIRPGVSLGYGAKGAWVQNDVDRSTILTGNSLGPGATPGSISVTDSDQDGTVMGEFEAKLVYRMTHSWTFRTAYYAMAIDDIAFGTVDAAGTRNVILSGANSVGPVQYDSLVLQGFSVGGEFMW